MQEKKYFKEKHEFVFMFVGEMVMLLLQNFGTLISLGLHNICYDKQSKLSCNMLM